MRLTRTPCAACLADESDEAVLPAAFLALLESEQPMSFGSGFGGCVRGFMPGVFFPLRD